MEQSVQIIEDEAQKENVQLKRTFLKSLLLPFIFVFLLWIVEIVQLNSGFRLSSLGILPRVAEGLWGIITSPFIHAGYDHLLSNTLPLLLVGSGLYYFYPTLAGRVVILTWLFTGIWVWLAGRASSHIGASGLVYGFVCFLFFSGLLRKDARLIAISLLVTFLYGSLVWGILPVDQSISWESHLFGALAGILCAVYYRNDGPQRPKTRWEIEEENGDDSSMDGVEFGPDLPEEKVKENSDPLPPPIQIRYHFKKDDDQSPTDKGF